MERLDLALDELLTHLEEEAAEVIQACTKMRRFGPGGTDPRVVRGPANHQALGMELGQLQAVRLAIQALDSMLLRDLDVEAGFESKLEKLQRYLKYSKLTVRDHSIEVRASVPAVYVVTEAQKEADEDQLLASFSYSRLHRELAERWNRGETEPPLSGPPQDSRAVCPHEFTTKLDCDLCGTSAVALWLNEMSAHRDTAQRKVRLAMEIAAEASDLVIEKATRVAEPRLGRIRRLAETFKDGQLDANEVARLCGPSEPEPRAPHPLSPEAPTKRDAEHYWMDEEAYRDCVSFGKPAEPSGPCSPQPAAVERSETPPSEPRAPIPEPSS